MVCECVYVCVCVCVCVWVGACVCVAKKACNVAVSKLRSLPRIQLNVAY